MKILGIRRLRGPNVYLDRPVAVARLRLDELTGRETSDLEGFTERLLRALPGLAEHHCAAGAPGGFVSRMRGGTYFGHVTEHVSIELSQRIGRDVSFGRTVSAGEPGLYDVIVECPQDESPESPLAAELLDAAAELVTAVAAGDCPPGAALAARVAALTELAEREAIGPSTRSIIAAARGRGIPVERYADLSLLRLGWGNRRRLAWAAMTDRTGGVGVDIAADKQVTRRLLEEAGVPVAAGGAARTAAEAVRLLTVLGAPVVVKPRRGRQGRNVALNLRTAADVENAYAAAGGDVVVERQLAGRDYRVLVVAGEVVAAAERLAAHVVGDGESTVAELVARTNEDPRRGRGHARVLTRIALDDDALAVLARQDCAPGAVPAAGRLVWLRENANLSTGGTGSDVTDRVHPEVAALCLRVAALVGLDIAGIDLRLDDIAAPLPPGGPARTTGGVIEVNAAPGLRMHLAPVRGRSRDVGDAIVRAMFPGGSDGRIPTVAVTGTNGKTTVARLTAYLLAGMGLRVGLTTTEGVSIDGRTVHQGDATGPRSAQMVLGDPGVQAAVLETARGGTLRRGLGYDWTDVGVITNITADHLGQDGLDSIEALAHVKALIAERVRDGGTLVLNADDPWVRSLAERDRVRADRKRIVWFGTDARQPVLAAHLGAGGTAYVLQDGWLVQATGARRTPLLRVEEVPGSFDGAAPHAALNALAAAAAARALGASHDLVAARLASFEPRRDNPGRATVLRVGEVTLFIDYAHNPAAIATVLRTLHRVFGPNRCLAAVTLPGDRRDDLLAASAQVLADGVGRVVLYEDEDPRGRTPGEVAGLVEREMRARRPQLHAVRAQGHRAAVEQALRLAAPGDVVLVMYEKLAAVLDHLEELGAVPAGAAVVPAERLTARPTLDLGLLPTRAGSAPG
ncbi:cyanophycin synthetase [Amorphoplanes digitatis]|uniref:Cyanophycin synthetase n=1 Tax=Actinoplanes digitatis TaxID=1868 RepID=A0A7W7MPC7_9ACTN|nr:cyanophycin synthetase [Actinoplanes digitatis]MBB4761224.1 cyanophycin synthetase [Actinoplanes digitatis]GID92841.1 cyanophycin synthetase [Actinoplanes digitatis]